VTSKPFSSTNMHRSIHPSIHPSIVIIIIPSPQSTSLSSLPLPLFPHLIITILLGGLQYSSRLFPRRHHGYASLIHVKKIESINETLVRPLHPFPPLQPVDFIAIGSNHCWEKYWPGALASQCQKEGEVGRRGKRLTTPVERKRRRKPGR